MRAQVEAYPNQRGPVLEALVYISPLAHDVLMYAVVQRLASPRRDKVKDDGFNAAEWLQACAPLAQRAAAICGMQAHNVVTP